MIYGYTRVSTKKQLEGHGLEVQKRAILERFPSAEIIPEQFTGKTTDRPIFDNLVNKLVAGDILVVHKLDRFARTTLEGMKLMNELLERGIIVEILNFGAIDGGFSSSNKLMMQIFFAFAEYERDCIVERTQAGKETAKLDPNFTEGRPPKYTQEDLEKAFKLKQQGFTYDQVKAQTGIGKTTLWNYSKNKEVI